MKEAHNPWLQVFCHLGPRRRRLFPLLAESYLIMGAEKVCPMTGLGDHGVSTAECAQNKAKDTLLIGIPMQDMMTSQRPVGSRGGALQGGRWDMDMEIDIPSARSKVSGLSCLRVNELENSERGDR